jgi:hypothetical protein
MKGLEIFALTGKIAVIIGGSVGLGAYVIAVF